MNSILSGSWIKDPMLCEEGSVRVSIALPIRAKDNPVKAIIKPGGIIHHQRPLAAAISEFGFVQDLTPCRNGWISQAQEAHAAPRLI